MEEGGQGRQEAEEGRVRVCTKIFTLFASSTTGQYWSVVLQCCCQARLSEILTDFLFSHMKFEIKSIIYGTQY